MMVKKIMMIASFLNCLAVFSMAHAADNCVEVTAESNNIGQFEAADCTNVWKALKASQKFPGIFSYPPKLLGSCYMSGPDGIQVKLGSKDVLVTTISAMTTDFIPNPAEGIFLASVITEWTIRNPNNNHVIGKIQSMETLDAVNSNELAVIIGGDRKFSRAKGAVRIESTPTDFDPQNQTATKIEIEKIIGRLCIPK